jgi:acyl carrier protein
MNRESINTEAALEAILCACEKSTGRKLARDAATASKSFAALGVDSVSVFEMQLFLEDRLGIELNETMLFENPTPGEAAAALARQLSPNG